MFFGAAKDHVTCVAS